MASPAPARASTRPPTGSLLRVAALNAALALAYWGLGELTLLAVSSAGQLTPLWPPAGLALVAVYAGGARLLPGVFAGSLLVMSTRGTPLGMLGVAVATVLQVQVELWVMRALKFDPRFERVRDAGVLGLASAPAGAAVGATVAVPLLAVAGQIAAARMPSACVLWWLRNWLGSVVAGGLGFAWRYARRIEWTWRRAAEAAGLLLTLALVIQGVFGLWTIYGVRDVPLAFVFFPLVGWAGLRFGARGATALVALASALALVVASLELGTFGTYPIELRQLVLHLFLLLAALSGLVLAGVMAEREEEFRRRHVLEDQLRHAQKMEAVGRLAGGIAHDFNNLLTAIIGYTEIVLQALPPGHPNREDAEEIARAAMRAAELTRQMLAFSRRQILQPQVINLNTVIAQMEPMLRRVIGEDIVMTIAPRAAHPLVRVDRGQIEQVVMNMVVNARDAMPQGGRLTIETTDAILDEEAARLHRDGRPGSYVVLVISDTGVGMTASVRSRIFDPYFTTKDVGKGTGLGLSTAYGIVRQSDGHITVYSEVGLGTTFRVYLPRAEAEAETPVEETSDETPRGTEHILLVEDDKMVRRLSREILTRLGYSVTEAASGRAALALGGDDTRRFDLLLCDVVLGDMNGPAVAEAIRVLRPSVRVLFMSGYTDEAIVQTGVLSQGAPFLQKPFTPVQLAQKVREVLDGPADV